ncbi:MAG: ATP-binding protein [Eubacterium sp.]|nr:ATP-binding protein [Eubacterium sp.]
MFIGREKELKQLESCFKKNENDIMILYGREGVGKTTLVKEFAKGKVVIYYQARELSEKEQCRYFDKKKEEIAQFLLSPANEKCCFVIDEFDLMQKGYKDFFKDFMSYLQTLPIGQVMILLVSSSVQWIENKMAEEAPELIGEISALIKLREFTFMEMVDRFPNSSTEEIITVYGILGGVPEYLDLWNPKESAKKNIIRLFLSNHALLRKEPSRFLKTVLRELPYYNTILSVLAEDEPKLNYLYNRTGFSRAKISVYIKNLIQLDVASKIFSFEPDKKDAVQKGLYGITDSLLEFYFKLIYPNISDLGVLSPDDFYAKYIKDELVTLMEKSYIRVCREFMDLMSRYDRLPEKFGAFTSMYGKTGFIPLVSRSENGKILIGDCKWSAKPMSMKDFEGLLDRTNQLGHEADYYYLFSRAGFTPELAAMATNMDNINCVSLEDL